MPLRPAPCFRKFRRHAELVSSRLTYQQNCQPNGMESGITPAASVHSGAGRSAQPYTSGIDAPVPSDFLGSLARRVILDLGTRVKAFNVEESGSGRLKVTITLETADIV
jgi:hypothetical protein